MAAHNKNMAKQSTKWIIENNIDAAICLVNNRQKVYYRTGHGNGYVWIETEKNLLYSGYITPRAKEEEYKQYPNELDMDIKKKEENIDWRWFQRQILLLWITDWR